MDAIRDGDDDMNANQCSTNAIHEALSTAILMAQELQDFVDCAEEAGDSLPTVRELIDEWETAYKRLPDTVK